MKREEDRATVDGVKGEGREKLGKTKGEIDAKKWTKKEGQGYGYVDGVDVRVQRE